MHEPKVSALCNLRSSLDRAIAQAHSNPVMYCHLVSRVLTDPKQPLVFTGSVDYQHIPQKGAYTLILNCLVH